MNAPLEGANWVYDHDGRTRRDSGSLLAVVPILSTQYADTCIDTLDRPNSASGLPADEVLLVDNTRDGIVQDRYGTPRGLRVHRDPDGHNLGVARSWNVGAREVLARPGCEYLVLISSVIQFGPILHTTLRWQIEACWGADVIETEGHSWHLVAIHRRLLELVGLFDGNYYPAYFEQIDWCTRLHKIGREGGWPHVWVNALSHGHGLHVDTVACPAPPLLDYYARKWGGPKGAETFDFPWGDRPMGWQEDEPIPVLAERYGLGPRGKNWW